MPEESVAAAASAYSSDRLTLYPFPESEQEFRLLMEIAFIQGARWQQEQHMTALKEATNA